MLALLLVYQNRESPHLKDPNWSVQWRLEYHVGSVDDLVSFDKFTLAYLSTNAAYPILILVF